MDSNTIFVSGCFDNYEESQLKEIKEELYELNVRLYSKNIKGEIYQASIDFFTPEFIAVSYELFNSFILSGSYDLFKSMILRLWFIIRGETSGKTSFAIEISGLPTEKGNETIRCAVSGNLSKKERTKVIDKTFELANQIEKNQYTLLEKDRYYNAVGAHLFNYDNSDNQLVEVDLEKEIKKKLGK